MSLFLDVTLVCFLLPLFSQQPQACAFKMPSSPHRERGNDRGRQIHASRMTLWPCRASVQLPKAHESSRVTKRKKNEMTAALMRNKHTELAVALQWGACVSTEPVLGIFFHPKSGTHTALLSEMGGSDVRDDVDFALCCWYVWWDWYRVSNRGRRRLSCLEIFYIHQGKETWLKWSSHPFFLFNFFFFFFPQKWSFSRYLW